MRKNLLLLFVVSIGSSVASYAAGSEICGNEINAKAIADLAATQIDSPEIVSSDFFGSDTFQTYNGEEVVTVWGFKPRLNSPEIIAFLAEAVCDPQTGMIEFQPGATAVEIAPASEE